MKCSSPSHRAARSTNRVRQIVYPPTGHADEQLWGLPSGQSINPLRTAAEFRSDVSPPSRLNIGDRLLPLRLRSDCVDDGDIFGVGEELTG